MLGEPGRAYLHQFYAPQREYGCSLFLHDLITGRELNPIRRQLGIDKKLTAMEIRGAGIEYSGARMQP